MKVVIAGEMPLLEEVGRLCVDAGHTTTLYVVEEFYDALVSGLFTSAARDANVAIELLNESVEGKRSLLHGMDQGLSPEALILTSALATSATEAASWVSNPQRVVGFGLLPPLRRAPQEGGPQEGGPQKGGQGEGESLVELAPALQSAPDAMQRAEAFWEGLGQTPVAVADGPGLVRPRVVCCLVNEAASALMEGVATAEDIDRAMQLGTNYPYGPLQWGDIIGLDTVLGVVTGLFREWGEDRYRPTPLLGRLVMAGRLGKKSGHGFYRYPPGGEGEGG